MKTLVAFLFTVITFVSLSQPANATCDDGDHGDHQTHAVAATHDSHSATDAEMHATHDSSQHSCPSESQCSNHSCHLGHCSFVIGTSVAIPSYATVSKTAFLMSTFVVPSGYRSSLFRPPIA